jgi:EmrB/QacA subfamily drug resistance transporter
MEQAAAPRQGQPTPLPAAEVRRILVLTSVASFLVPCMGSALNVAMPTLGAEFGASAVTLNWIVGAYLIASAAMLLPFGRLADLVGRKRVFVTGLVIHAVCSFGCSLAPDTASLIMLRFLQGGSAALGFSTGMAILTSAVSPATRGRALGIVTSAVYAGLAMGPVIGGVITQNLGWRAIFVASGVVSLGVGAGMHLGVGHEWRPAHGARFDRIGAVVYSGSLAALIAGLSAWRTFPAVRWILPAAAVGLAAFLVRQTTAVDPLLDLGLFRNPVFALSNLAALIHYCATFAVSFLMSLYLQVALGLDPQQAGLVLLAQPAVMAALSPIAGWASDRIEPRLVATAGMLITSAGLFALSTLGSHSSVVTATVILLVLGAGFGLFSSPNSNAVMSAVDRAHYGVGSATLATMRLVGQSLSLVACNIDIETIVCDDEACEDEGDWS